MDKFNTASWLWLWRSCPEFHRSAAGAHWRFVRPTHYEYESETRSNWWRRILRWIHCMRSAICSHREAAAGILHSECSSRRRPVGRSVASECETAATRVAAPSDVADIAAEISRLTNRLHRTDARLDATARYSHEQQPTKPSIETLVMVVSRLLGAPICGGYAIENRPLTSACHRHD